MTDKEQNKSEVHQEPTSKDITGMNLQGKDRRRFIKRAIVAAPFILTVTSRPVWACNCTMSGQLSGNLSDGAEPCGGEGCSPGFWKNHTERWHSQYPTTLSFGEVFQVFPWTPQDPSLYQVISFWDELEPEEPLVDVLGFHAVAALQNSATAVSFELMVYDVIEMVADAYTMWESTGHKSYLKKVKTYLDGLNNVPFGCPW